MRFVCTIMHKTTVLARVSIDDKPGENPMRVAENARQTLARDANRHRSERLTDTLLAQFADVYREVAASQTISRQSRTVTCVSQGQEVRKFEGTITLLSGPDDLTCLIEAYDDAWIAERDELIDGMLTEADSGIAA